MRVFMYIENDAPALITTLSGRVGAREQAYFTCALWLRALSKQAAARQRAALALRVSLCVCFVRFVAAAVVRGAHACKRECAFTRANERAYAGLLTHNVANVVFYR